jgi:plasmid maintenance system antidote protein VapI
MKNGERSCHVAQKWSTDAMPKYTTARALKTELAGVLKQRMASGDFDVSSFAKRMKTSRSAVRRLLDTKNTAITIRTLARAAEVAGLEITFTLRQKSPVELTDLARQLADTKSASKAARLKKDLVAGFYGQA